MAGWVRISAGTGREVDRCLRAFGEVWAEVRGKGISE